MTLHEIVCYCESKRGKNNTQKRYLGDIAVIPGNVAHHYCKGCNTTYEYAVGVDGLVTRSIVNHRIKYPDKTVRVG